jgi:signal transduction histidine kinase
MARLTAAISGRTLARAEGFAGLRPADLWYSVRRAALTLVSIGALIAGVSATSAALGGFADAGVAGTGLGDPIPAVSPTGYAWAAGIRPGQIVDSIIASDEPGGWRMDTHDAAGPHVVQSTTSDNALRSTTPIALGALLLAYLSIVFLRTRRRWVLPTAAIAVLVASIPLWLAGNPGDSTMAMGAAALLPAAAYTTRISGWRWVRWAATAVVVALVAIWAALRLSGSDAYATAELVRGNVALWGTLALVVERAVWPSMTGQSLGVVRPRLFNAVVVAGLAALILVFGSTLHLDLFVEAGVVIALLAVVPVTRHRLAPSIERLLLGDVREQAAAEASEAERARLARELHDVPLQELAAVIRRLEILPGAEAESEDLRALAGHLRNVATELRPPVLDDLGLPAALDFLAEEATTPALPVITDVVDDTGFGADRRPPTDVELAMFRIASEAVGNAIRHSGGSEITVHAAIAPDKVSLEVSDDGAGMPSEAARDAARRKRLGLASMRRRAEAIDAELSIDGSARGTTVRAVWQA